MENAQLRVKLSKFKNNFSCVQLKSDNLARH